MSNGNTRYSFEFVIKLHIDHAPLLKNIRDTLGIGRIAIQPSSNSSTFEVASEKELRILIDLLDKNTLIGTKYLDFLSFRKAFFLYFDRSGLITESLRAGIEKIRESHNTKRIDFKMPVEYKCVITDYKLLGLIEGDGSFMIQKRDLTPKFELELTSSQKPLLEAIKDYLISKLDLSNLNELELRTRKRGGIRIRDRKSKSNSKPSVRLEIVGIGLLHNYFNPYLEQKNFYSDKRQDFETFSFICKTLHSKAHIQNPQVRDQLLKLAGGMNNARLSTYKNKVD